MTVAQNGSTGDLQLVILIITAQYNFNLITVIWLQEKNLRSFEILTLN